MNLHTQCLQSQAHSVHKNNCLHIFYRRFTFCILYAYLLSLFMFMSVHEKDLCHIYAPQG
jgi:hypothetical protein